MTTQKQDLSTMPLAEITKLPGVEDLKPSVKCRGKFAMALKMEAQGDHEKAARYLAGAVEAEER